MAPNPRAIRNLSKILKGSPTGVRAGFARGFKYGVGDVSGGTNTVGSQFGRSAIFNRAPKSELEGLNPAGRIAFGAARVPADLLTSGTRSRTEFNSQIFDFLNTASYKISQKQGAPNWVAKAVFPPVAIATYQATTGRFLGARPKEEQALEPRFQAPPFHEWAKSLQQKDPNSYADLMQLPVDQQQALYDKVKRMTYGKDVTKAAAAKEVLGMGDSTIPKNPVGERVQRFLFQRSGQLLPYDELQKVRPDITKEEYDNYRSALSAGRGEFGPYAGKGYAGFNAGVHLKVVGNSPVSRQPELQIQGTPVPVYSSLIPSLGVGLGGTYAISRAIASRRSTADQPPTPPSAQPITPDDVQAQAQRMQDQATKRDRNTRLKGLAKEQLRQQYQDIDPRTMAEFDAAFNTPPRTRKANAPRSTATPSTPAPQPNRTGMDAAYQQALDYAQKRGITQPDEVLKAIRYAPGLPQDPQTQIAIAQQIARRVEQTRTTPPRTPPAFKTQDMNAPVALRGRQSLKQRMRGGISRMGMRPMMGSSGGGGPVDSPPAQPRMRRAPLFSDPVQQAAFEQRRTDYKKRFSGFQQSESKATPEEAAAHLEELKRQTQKAFEATGNTKAKFTVDSPDGWPSDFYLRQSERMLGGKRQPTFELANIQIAPYFRGTGVFEQLLEHYRQTYPDRAFYGEATQPRLAQVLHRQGYELVPGSTPDDINLYRPSQYSERISNVLKQIEAAKAKLNPPSDLPPQPPAFKTQDMNAPVALRGRQSLKQRMRGGSSRMGMRPMMDAPPPNSGRSRRASDPVPEPGVPQGGVSRRASERAAQPKQIAPPPRTRIQIEDGPALEVQAAPRRNPTNPQLINRMVGRDPGSRALPPAPPRTPPQIELTPLAPAKIDNSQRARIVRAANAVNLDVQFSESKEFGSAVIVTDLRTGRGRQYPNQSSAEQAIAGIVRQKFGPNPPRYYRETPPPPRSPASLPRRLPTRQQIRDQRTAEYYQSLERIDPVLERRYTPRYTDPTPRYQFESVLGDLRQMRTPAQLRGEVDERVVSGWDDDRTLQRRSQDLRDRDWRRAAREDRALMGEIKGILRQGEDLARLQQQNRANLPELEDLFLAADRIGNKYQTEAERAAFTRQQNQLVGEIGDLVDRQFPTAPTPVADFTQPKRRALPPAPRMADPTDPARVKANIAKLRSNLKPRTALVPAAPSGLARLPQVPVIQGEFVDRPRSTRSSLSARSLPALPPATTSTAIARLPRMEVATPPSRSLGITQTRPRSTALAPLPRPPAEDLSRFINVRHGKLGQQTRPLTTAARTAGRTAGRLTQGLGILGDVAGELIGPAIEYRIATDEGASNRTAIARSAAAYGQGKFSEFLAPLGVFGSYGDIPRQSGRAVEGIGSLIKQLPRGRTLGQGLEQVGKAGADITSRLRPASGLSDLVERVSPSAILAAFQGKPQALASEIRMEGAELLPMKIPVVKSGKQFGNASQSIAEAAWAVRGQRRDAEVAARDRAQAAQIRTARTRQQQQRQAGINRAIAQGQAFNQQAAAKGLNSGKAQLISGLLGGQGGYARFGQRSQPKPKPGLTRTGNTTLDTRGLSPDMQARVQRAFAKSNFSKPGARLYSALGDLAGSSSSGGAAPSNSGGSAISKLLDSGKTPGLSPEQRIAIEEKKEKGRNARNTQTIGSREKLAGQNNASREKIASDRNATTLAGIDRRGVWNYKTQDMVSGRRLEGTKYTADSRLTGTKYTADSRLKGTMYTANKRLEGTKYTADKRLQGTVYTADRRLQGVDLTSGRKLQGEIYKADQKLAGEDLKSGRKLEGDKYTADQKVVGETVKGRYKLGGESVKASAQFGKVLGDIYSRKAGVNRFW